MRDGLNEMEFYAFFRKRMEPLKLTLKWILGECQKHLN